jgi:hypothetical protein
MPGHLAGGDVRLAAADDDVERARRQLGPATHAEASIAGVPRHIVRYVVDQIDGRSATVTRAGGHGGDPAGSVREPLLRQRPALHGVDERPDARLDDLLVVPASADAHGVGAGTNRERCSIGDGPCAGDGVHVEGVGDDQAAEAETVTEEPHRRGRERCRQPWVERLDHEVSQHDGLDPRVDGCAEGDEIHSFEPLPAEIDPWQVGVRIGVRGTVARKVLGAPQDARCGEALDVRGDMAGDVSGLGPEGAHADDGAVRRLGHVRDMGEIPVDTGRDELAADRRRGRAGDGGVTGGCQRQGAEVRGAVGVVQTRDIAALLVQAGQDVGPHAPQHVDEPPHLPRVDHVAAEQADAAEAAFDSAGQPRGWHGRAAGRRLEHGVRPALELTAHGASSLDRSRGQTGRHPAVRPGLVLDRRAGVLAVERLRGGVHRLRPALLGVGLQPYRDRRGFTRAAALRSAGAAAAGGERHRGQRHHGYQLPPLHRDSSSPLRVAPRGGNLTGRSSPSLVQTTRRRIGQDHWYSQVGRQRSEVSIRSRRPGLDGAFPDGTLGRRLLGAATPLTATRAGGRA